MKINDLNAKLKRFVILFFMSVLWLPNSQIMAQENIDKEPKSKSFIGGLIQDKKISIKVDYFGELGLHPGGSLGIDYTISTKKWVTIHWDTEIGGYWHRWNHSALFTKTSIGARFPIWSLFVDINLGAGYMHSFLAGDVYQRAAGGGIEKAPNTGRPHFMPTCSLLLGWDGTRKSDLPWKIHLGIEAYYQSGFNHIFLPHVAAKVGVSYLLKNK